MMRRRIRRIDRAEFLFFQSHFLCELDALYLVMSHGIHHLGL